MPEYTFRGNPRIGKYGTRQVLFTRSAARHKSPLPLVRPNTLTNTLAFSPSMNTNILSVYLAVSVVPAHLYGSSDRTACLD